MSFRFPQFIIYDCYSDQIQKECHVQHIRKSASLKDNSHKYSRQHLSVMYVDSSGSRISQTRGANPWKKEENLLFDKIFAKKLHENERNWTEVGAHPGTSLDPSMVDTESIRRNKIFLKDYRFDHSCT